MLARVKREKEGVFLELPNEFELTGEVEVYPIKNGFYVIAPAEEKKGEAGKKENEEEIKLDEDEVALLRKLNAIKFEQRIPDQVRKGLTVRERAALKKLIEKKYIIVLKGKKYKQGVYNIPQRVYEEFRSAPLPDVPVNSIEHLNAYGYMIAENEERAKQAGQSLAEEIKGGKVMGVRGFDRKFYVATTNFFKKYHELVLNAVPDEGAGYKEIAEKCNMEENACSVILMLMSESGELIEKRKGNFAKA